ncbi:bZIP transcription factor 60 [Platanthera zijinensis]|uniref:BZIP transcription factor 60 n=1 Tax=Platanthera zijinensis TaxID=2320716 RepID=A0AAP0BEH0_9ASPA
MRNRESAIKSRERKKMYTKDLEMKSKYLESECRRLDNLLRCYMVENSVLRQSLQFQKERICGASMAKQENYSLTIWDGKSISENRIKLAEQLLCGVA